MNGLAMTMSGPLGYDLLRVAANSVHFLRQIGYVGIFRRLRVFAYSHDSIGRNQCVRHFVMSEGDGMDSPRFGLDRHSPVESFHIPGPAGIRRVDDAGNPFKDDQFPNHDLSYYRLDWSLDDYLLLYLDRHDFFDLDWLLDLDGYYPLNLFPDDLCHDPIDRHVLLDNVNPLGFDDLRLARGQDGQDYCRS